MWASVEFTCSNTAATLTVVVRNAEGTRFRIFLPVTRPCVAPALFKTSVCGSAGHSKIRHWAPRGENRDSTSWLVWRCLFVTGVSFLFLCCCACLFPGFGHIQRAFWLLCAVEFSATVTSSVLLCIGWTCMGLYCVILQRMRKSRL
jgi:hypothetical protein